MHIKTLNSTNRILNDWMYKKSSKERKDLVILVGKNDDSRQIKRERFYKAQSAASQVEQAYKACLKEGDIYEFKKLFKVYQTLTHLSTRLSHDIKEARVCEVLMK